MSVAKIKAILVKCDDCHEERTWYYEVKDFDDEEIPSVVKGMREGTIKAGWICDEKHNKDFCPECAHLWENKNKNENEPDGSGKGSDMKVIIVDPPENMEEKIAKAAKMCYSASTVSDLMERVEKQDQESFIKKIIAIGHESVLEHVNLSFAVEGVSRVFSHQLVRHRIASYSQQSQRYVSLDKTFEYITPESISKNSLSALRYHNAMNSCHDIYKALLDDGIPAEDARFVLPNATETKVFLTMNIRTLLHFFKVRCCNRAQWEIRAMAIEMLKQCKKLSPIIFDNAGPSCVQGECGEGKMTCGNPLSTRRKFQEM